MTGIINVHGLTEEDIKFVEKLVSLLRTKPKVGAGQGQASDMKLECATWPATITGQLTREELYEDR